MMHFSCAHHKRKRYMKHLQVPPFSEARNQLGNDLTQVLIDECPESLKHKMHLSNPLRGPGPNLWLSPSDLLIGKVVLTPPLTAKHIKALTHEGILNMGEQLEAQWLAAVELEKRLAMENLEELLMLLAERDKERAVEEALRNCEEKFREYMDSVNADFEALLVQELAALETSLREYYEDLIEKQIEACHDLQDDFLNEHIDDAVNATVHQLTEKFMKDLAEQEAELESLFKAKLAGQREKHLEALRHQEEVFTVVMKQLKHNLQCNNIASLMYVLCLERRRCIYEQQTLIDSTTGNTKQLLNDNKKMQAEIEQLKCEAIIAKRKLLIREDCLLGVIAQFQKFINYALRATPTQAEFLLSIEKMMTLELTQSLVRTQEGKKPRMARVLMPWRKVSEESIKSAPTHNLDLEYHDCLNEQPQPKCPNADEELLAMTYKNRVYIREDFRNRVSQGFHPRPSNALWSKDIEDLIVLIETVNENDVSPKISSSRVRVDAMNSSSEARRGGSVYFLNQSEFILPDPAGLLGDTDSVDIQKSHHSTLQFLDKVDTVEIDLALPAHAQTERGQDDGAPVLKQSAINLLAVKDSLTLIKERRGSSLVPSQQADADERELEVIPAPSDATIQLRKQQRRVTTYPSKMFDGTYSEVTLKLTKNRPSISKLSFGNGNNQSGIIREHKEKKISFNSSRTVHTATPTSTPVPNARLSSIKDHIDSLELISVASNTHMKLKNIITPTDIVDPEYPTQQMMIVVDAPQETRDFPDVNFKRVAEVFNDLYKPEKPWTIYKKKPVLPINKPSVAKQPVDNNFLKQDCYAKVMGDASDKKEVNDCRKDFTIHRIHSILDVLRKDDSLCRLFTKCTQ